MKKGIKHKINHHFLGQFKDNQYLNGIKRRTIVKRAPKKLKKLIQVAYGTTCNMHKHIMNRTNLHENHEYVFQIR